MMDEEKAYKDLKELVKRVPHLKEIFGEFTKDDTPEIWKKKKNDIPEIWKKNVIHSTLPAVIQLGEYVYGVGGILFSEKSRIYTDEDVLNSIFLYTSIWEAPMFRDILYFIGLCDKEIQKGIFKYIYEKYIKGKNDLQKIYDNQTHNYPDFKDNPLLKIALMIQILYSRLDTSEIEEFYKDCIRFFNERLKEKGEKILKHLHEEYEAFYLTYKKEEKIYTKCYLITRYGVVEDLGFAGEKQRDPVDVLAEKIDFHWKDDRIFEKWLEKRIERYKTTPKRVDKIYEYLMENDDLDECELKDNFKSSCIMEEIFKEIFGELSDYIIQKTVEKEEHAEILYRLTLLACGFEMGCAKVNPSALLPHALVKGIEKAETEISGILSDRERDKILKRKVEEMVRDLEYFLSSFLPFWILKSICKGDIREIRKQKSNFLKEVVEKKDDRINTIAKFPLGELVNRAQKFIEKEEIKKSLDEINKIRNKIFHPVTPEGFLEVTLSDFKEMCEKLKNVYKEMSQMEFYLVKIKKIVEDGNARSYIVGEEVDTKRRWYITFDEDWIYDEIDPTYLYYMTSPTNPVARNPFMAPVTLKFEIERLHKLTENS